MASPETTAPCVLHFIPQDGIGGAEIAARSATRDPAANVHVHAMFNGLYSGEGAIANPRLTGNATRFAFSPRSIAGALAKVRELDPQVLVFSLWRSFGAFLACKLRHPDRKFVTFVHNERIANRIDYWLTELMKRGSDEIWVDSQATLDARLDANEKRRARIISLRLDRNEREPRRDPAPRFVYWGRLAEQKRIDRAIALFAEIAANRPDAHFTLIGPDHGVGDRLRRQAESLGVSGQLTFHGPSSQQRIAELAGNARFFLQLSAHEGMAMGVVEALEAGLVPVVTPVGQMAVYCRDGENALVCRDRAETARRLGALIDDPGAYSRMSAAAIATFADQPVYTEDVASAALELAAGEGDGRRDGDGPLERARPGGTGAAG